MFQKFLTAAVVMALSVSILRADDSPEVSLDKIVVTPYRYEESLAKTALDVTTITSDDIKKSNAQNIIAVLSTTCGITARDWYGNGVKAAVDIGGFGEQSALNVLVLVDGRRINDVDLSGVDWSQIPIDRVERIEVIRGGAGAVLYGDNASSGVVNIITKKGSGKPKIQLSAEYGSYDMHKEKLSLDGRINNKFSYWLGNSWDSTNGYRENSYNKTKDFGSKISYDFTDILSVHFDSGFHDATYGLPGALFQSDIDQHNRRYARFGEDHANNKDYYFVTGFKSDFSEIGNFGIDFSYRQKDTDAYFYSSTTTQRNKIETFGITPKYTFTNPVFGRENNFIAGLDYYRVLYGSKSYDSLNDTDLESYTDVNKISIAGYFQDEFSILEKLILVGGYRYEAARYVFGYHDYTGWNPDQDTKITPSMNAFNTGLVYNYRDDSSVFLNIGESFRFPEVDEFNYVDSSYKQQLNTGLSPQKSTNYQLGVRHNFSNRLKGNLSLYRMNVKNEIYYNATDTYSYGYWDGKNDNYDKTIHEGIDASVELKLNASLKFFGNYAFTHAYFDGGQYDKNEIPMVPRHKGSLGINWALPKNFIFNATGTYVGKRYFLNDQANAYSRLNGYMVIDTNLSWRYKDLIITFAINNLFDKQYSEYAGVLQGWSSGHSVGDKFYYPSPRRNFSLKAEYKF